MASGSTVEDGIVDLNKQVCMHDFEEKYDESTCLQSHVVDRMRYSRTCSSTLFILMKYNLEKAKLDPLTLARSMMNRKLELQYIVVRSIIS